MYLSKLILCRNSKINFLNSETSELNKILDTLTLAIHHTQRCTSVSRCESDPQILYAKEDQLSIKVHIRDLAIGQQGRILCEPISVSSISSWHQQEVSILGEDRVILQDGSRLEISALSSPQANKKTQKIQNEWLLASGQFSVIQSAIDRVTCLANISVILSSFDNKRGTQNEKTFQCMELESIHLPQGKALKFLEF